MNVKNESSVPLVSHHRNDIRRKIKSQNCENLDKIKIEICYYLIGQICPLLNNGLNLQLAAVTRILKVKRGTG